MAATGKRLKAEQIVNLLREIDVMTANGKTLLEACKQAEISDKSYLWRTQSRPGQEIQGNRSGERHAEEIGGRDILA